MEAADSRCGALPYSASGRRSPVRRNGQASLFFVAVSRRGAPGGAVTGRATIDSSLRQTSH